jgi:hypothetical protein
LPFLLSPGQRELSFYAVNDFGFVSPPSNLFIDVIPDATPTASKTPTTSQSPRETRTPTQSRSPTATVRPTPSLNRSPAYGSHPISLLATASPQHNFNINWFSPTDYTPTISTSLGYGTALRVNNTTVFVSGGLPVNTSSVTLTTRNITLSEFSILVTFVLTNAAPDDVLCDVSLYADTRVGSTELHLVQTLPDGLSFFWQGTYSGVEYTMHPVIRHDPLVSDATAYWFGGYKNVSLNYWSQTTENSSWGVDVGFTVSWQRISVPGNGMTTVSVMFRSGLHNTSRPVVSNVEAGRDGYVLATGRLLIQFSLSESRPGAWVRAFFFVDGDRTRIADIPGTWSGPSVAVGFDLTLYDVGLGTHLLSVYVVDDLGLVSDGVDVEVNVVNEIPKPSSNGGAIAGIVIGVLIVVGAAVALVVWRILKRPSRHQGDFKHIGDDDLTAGAIPL